MQEYVPAVVRIGLIESLEDHTEGVCWELGSGLVVVETQSA
jgi:hypothetical protein